MESANGGASNLNGKRPYGTAAKLYRDQGWLGTLPLPKGEKSSPPKGFTGGGRDHPSESQVAKWAKERPDGNLALRLAEVPREFWPATLPIKYADNIVDGWELIGIDVDDYKAKQGHAEYRALVEGKTEHGALGELPATAMSSARWDTWDEHRSSIRVFFVPKGFRYMGKAADSIEVVQRRHRYMVAWPSTNPDANGAMYEWRYGDAMTPSDELLPAPSGMPPLSAVAVLPEAWFRYLTRDGLRDSDDPISAMTDDALFHWLQTDLRFDGEPCRVVQNAVDRWIADLDTSSDSHTKMVPAHNQIIGLAAEGHSGIHSALDQYNRAWFEHVKEFRGGGSPEDVQGELNRSIFGALSKHEPKYAQYDKAGEVVGHYLADDQCTNADGVTGAQVSNWGPDDEALIAEFEYGGLGTVVGPMELLPTKPANEYGQHDVGNGQHFIDLYGGSVKYVDGRGSWVLWDGWRWHRDTGGRHVAKAFSRVRLHQEAYAAQLRRAAAQLESDDDDDSPLDPKALRAEAKSWSTWAKRSGNSAPIRAALEMAECEYVDDIDPVAMVATQFDSRPDLLGCTNGVVELTDDPIVRNPRKEDYVTFNTNVAYIPWRQLAMTDDDDVLGGLEKWLLYLNTFLSDDALRHYVQKVLGSTIIGENPEKHIVFLHGPHDTGKSTMLGAIKGALGDYYGTIDMALFKPKDLNPGLMRACPLRVAGMSEVDGGKMDVATVKRLTGNDPVQAELKYSNEIFEGRPQFTVVVACNNAPNVPGADEALKERLVVLPFQSTVEKSLRDYNKQTEIEKQSGVAVLSWLVEGWRLYCEEGLGSPPRQVRKAQRELFEGLNEQLNFVGACLELADNTQEGRRVMKAVEEKAQRAGKAKVTVSDWPIEWTPTAASVYTLYTNWCRQNNIVPVSAIALTKEMGVPRPQNRSVEGRVQKCYVGMRLKQ